MRRQVWKYALEPDGGPQLVQMPARAMVLHVEQQHHQWCMWVEVDPSKAPEDRWFIVVGTGHPVPDGAIWVGTALMAGGHLVWHVYECEDPTDG